MGHTESVDIVRWTGDEKNSITDNVIIEYPLTIFVNGEELVTLLCTPIDLKELAIGFLFSEGFIKGIDDLGEFELDEKNGIAKVRTKSPVDFTRELFSKRTIASGCEKSAIFYNARDSLGQRKVTSDTSISSRVLIELNNSMQKSSVLYRTTGCAHSAALCDTEKILSFKEDIGRHNALDKVLGDALLKDMPTNGKIILTSGRASSEIVVKSVRHGIAILVSRSAPTNLAVKIATQSGLTLIGFARGNRMNIYSNGNRIIAKGSEIRR